MISLFDASTLAYTKLRTRRIRTIVTVVTASLLFGVIILATLFIQGTLTSTVKFNKGTLSERYLVNATFNDPKLFDFSATPLSVKTRGEQLYAKVIADKKAAAKKLGVEYDSSVEQKPLTNDGYGSEYFNPASPYAIQAMNEYVATQKSNKENLKELITPYKPLKIYEVSAGRAFDGQIKPIQNGAEDFSKQPTYPTYGGTADISLGWSYMDQMVTKSFMLPEAQLKQQKNINDIPVIAPISNIEAALGLKPLSKDVSSKERLARIVYLRDNAHKATFPVCYRNTVSQSQIESAINTAKDIAANAANKSYKKPSLIYKIPADASACLPATVASDTRTAEEKKNAAKQDEFTVMFGQEVVPRQQKITFRVVGLAPNALSGDSFSGISSLVTIIAGSTLNGQWVVPQQMFDSMPNRQDFNNLIPGEVKDLSRSISYNDARSIVEFSSVDDAKRFVDKVGCGSDYCQNGRSVTYFGSNSVLIDEIRGTVVYTLTYVALVAASIAALIMMGMIGRVIGDSRRETAVFRAIGAKRNDLRLIYVMYTAMLSSLVGVSSLLVGYIAAVVIDSKLSTDASVQAHMIYLFSDDALRFSFIGVWWQAILIVLGLIIATGLTGMLLPLSRNLGRNPIKDMRDE